MCTSKQPGYEYTSLVKGEGGNVHDGLPNPADDPVYFSKAESSGYNTPEEDLYLSRFPVDHAQNLRSGLKNVKVTAQQPTDARDDGSSSVASSIRNNRTSSTESTTTISTNASTVATHKAGGSVASNFSRKLSRESWALSSPATPSRSPSPSKAAKGADAFPLSSYKGQSQAKPGDTAHRADVHRQDSSQNSNTNDGVDSRPSVVTGQTDTVPVRKPSLLRRKTSRATIMLKNSFGSKHDSLSQSTRPSVPSVPKSFSTDRLPSHHLLSTTSRAAPVPRMLSSEKASGNTLVKPKKKDELWSVFRTLDADIARMTSKTIAFKAGVVRSSLLPFLRTYATHPSNNHLRPEDLDRRANILNKWWTGLLEMLHGRYNQSISGTDRPVVLEGIAGIMERPEWRQPTPFSPLKQRKSENMLTPKPSTTSLMSNSSDFLTESVHQNVRNIFVQNLSAQMAFVVDKMSLHNASASLVTFCGKACAYAFVFVPGMADMLARLWEVPKESIRRVLDGNGIGRLDNITDVTQTITPGFPPALQQLGFVSFAEFLRMLRHPPPPPLATANVQWWGEWISRWSGQSTDLFYVFVKHFHILVTDFLPEGSSRKDNMAAPGMLLVHAQILTNLDATIHRDAKKQEPLTNGPALTFDDVFGPDASAASLLMPPANAVRSMAENRMMMLVRDFLSDRAEEYPDAKRLFALSFNDLLQTAVRGTCIFDHAACYTLLDFLEEALVLLVRFEHSKKRPGTLVKYEFWKTVFSKMMTSQNTMTDIRLFAFLYTIWNTVICSLGWKSNICFDLLLDPQIFEERFNHWCPMVRAYFMRLLCWRVARQDGDSSNVDFEILETMLKRLHLTWSDYLFFRAEAEQKAVQPPSTSPSYPAPSRRLLIVRTDTQLNPSGKFMSFDGMLPQKTTLTSAQLALKRSSAISQITVDMRPDSIGSGSESEVEPRGRGIGGLIRGIFGAKDRSRSRTSSRSKTRREDTPVPDLPKGIARSASELGHSTASESSSSPLPVSQHRNCSFKFSLEFQMNMRPLPPMRLSPPRLPLPAQQTLMAFVREASTAGARRNGPPDSDSRAHARYCGRALAEWAIVLGDCQSFFDRRISDGVPSHKLVETPTLGVEVFKRPG